MVRFNGPVPGAAGLHLVDGVPLLRPEEQVLAAMLTGFANQHLARNLARTTVEGRENTVKAFAAYVNAYPWLWTPAMVDEWLGDLRSLRDLKRSTIRSYSEAVRAFCHFITDPLYEWTATCEERFGTHPVPVVHEWNTAVHVLDNEADAKKRAFTKAELHAFFAHCDDEVARIRAFGRKGWLPAFRDATLFKTAYAYGTRRNETRMLDAADFGRNPHGGEFGQYGRCQVRFGKAKKDSPPKRCGVLTVFDWTPDVLDEWFTEVRPLFGTDNNPAAWPSERGLRIGCQRLNSCFIAHRKALGLDDGLDFHSVRRSYVTHLIEDGWDPCFVQEQVGHEHASTTSLYTCVSSDFRTRTLRRAASGLHHRRRPPDPDREASMKRKVGYTWRLREVMAQHQIFTATELVPLLRERGIDLSASQVHRLVSGTPERLSLQVMAPTPPTNSTSAGSWPIAADAVSADTRPAPGRTDTSAGPVWTEMSGHGGSARDAARAGSFLGSVLVMGP
ncbi:tyrosine-type recombinase/integrase [Streptomyces sp. NPDC048290]|uniref:tyrosine-type recombinase/integrase n=1 Tax=Streptomyces sp. NPDC048290 TaxID=3155811 RepID=UPI00341FC9AF